MNFLSNSESFEFTNWKKAELYFENNFCQFNSSRIQALESYWKYESESFISIFFNF
jgi:hypothetical protein